MNISSRVAQSLHDGTIVAKVMRRFRQGMSFGLYHLPELAFKGELHWSEDLIRDDICLPPFYGHPDHDDVTPMLAVAKAMEPQLVVEFGTAQGNITANICRQTSAHVITVNAAPEHMSGHWITFALDRDEIGKVYRQYGFEERVEQIYANTLEIDLANYLPPNSVDVGIVDACHDYEYVLNDFLKLTPYVRPGGVILLHDTHPSMSAHLEGSYLACMYLRRKGWDIQHVRDTWWGIWIRGGLGGSKLAQLFSQPLGSRVWGSLQNSLSLAKPRVQRS